MAGMLYMQSVPLNEMEVWKGVDADDFEKTFDVFEDAIKNGFRHFQKYIDSDTDDWLNIGAACQHYDFCRILRYIQTIDAPVIYLHDNQYFPKHYQAYLDLYKYTLGIADRDNTELKYLALDWSRSRHFIAASDLDAVAPENTIIRGIPGVGADVGAIITPSGARWLLKTYDDSYMFRDLYVHPILECTFEDLITKQMDMSGVYAVAADGKWLHSIPADIAPSNIYADESCSVPRRPLRETRRTPRKSPDTVRVWGASDVVVSDPSESVPHSDCVGQLSLQGLPKKQLGSLPIHATVIGVGTDPYRHEFENNKTLSIDQKVDVLQYAIKQGINYIDTAPAYVSAHQPLEHRSENIIRQALQALDRGSVYLTTKSHIDMEWTPDPTENLSMLQSYFETSLKRLGTEYVDNFLLHETNILQHPEAIGLCVEAIQNYKAQGLIKGGIGIGTVKIEIAEKILEQGWADIIQLGGGYECYGSQHLRETHPDFVEEMQRQGITFMNCQVFCKNVDAPDFHKKALLHSVNSPIVDLTVVGMYRREDVDANIATVSRV